MCDMCPTSTGIGYRYCPKCGVMVNDDYTAPKILECSKCHKDGPVEPVYLTLGACPSCGIHTQRLLLHPPKPLTRIRAKSGSHPSAN